MNFRRYTDYSYAVTDLVRRLKQARQYTLDGHWDSALFCVRQIQECAKYWEMWLIGKRDAAEKEVLDAING